MPFYAHSTDNPDKSDWETVAEHAEAVAERAARAAEPFGGAKAARLLGLLHDLGKFDPRFQKRLSDGSIRVDHSTAGARLLSDLAVGELSAPGRQRDRIAAELMAAAVAGHHAGLPDRRGAEAAALDARIEDCDLARLDAAWRAAVLPLDLSNLFPAGFRPSPVRAFLPFQIAFLGRMLFSALVDGDRRATEAFYASRGEPVRDRDWPTLQSCLPRLRETFARKIEAFCQPTSPLAHLRAEILAHVRGKASMAPGLFTLAVPTGGGKTLASLGFALDHAAHHNELAGKDRFRRIVVAIPFTSVTQQTAAAFREALGEGVVLEHHSAFETEKDRTARQADSDEAMRDKMRLAMEDWAAPVVVTTHVQLFESLFASRPSETRKLHNLAGSIVVLDEAQVLPLGLLGPTVRAIDELARNYGCTVVLCTATQPAFDARHYTEKNADSPLALDLKGRELAPDPDGLHRRLKRATIRRAPAPMSDDELVDALAGTEQGFVIVNTRAHALALYRLAKRAGLEGLVHLTTRQHASDRQRILADVRARLRPPEKGGGQPCRLVATSLVEAGVDFDFPAGWRAETGLDSIVQAAGRVNREGEKPPETSVLTVFSPLDAKPPVAFADLIADMRDVFRRFPDDPASPEAMTDYFREVYWRTGKNVDAKRLLAAEGEDVMMRASSGLGTTDIAYRRIAEAYRMIDQRMMPVIVPPPGEEERIRAMLATPTIPSGAIARELQPFVVQVPERARGQLMAAGHVVLAEERLRADQFPILRTASLYAPEVGLIWEEPGYLAVEGLIL